MFQEKIEVTDMLLAKLLIATRLRDRGVHIDHKEIKTVVKNVEHQAPQIRFCYPLRKLTVTIQSRLGQPEEITAEKILDIAEAQAEEYYRLFLECDGLEEQLAEAKAVAKREVAKAKRRGMPVRLLAVQPSVVEADNGWLPLPDVLIEILNAALIPERISIVAEYMTDIADDLTHERFVTHQAIRAVRKEWFDCSSAGGAIDAVALAALRNGGHDISEVIGRMLAKDEGFALESGGLLLYLRWNDGIITVSFKFGDGHGYTRGRVSVGGSTATRGRQHLVGKPVSLVVEDAVLQGSLIAATKDRSGEMEITVEPRFHLFDAETLQPREHVFPMPHGWDIS